MATTRPVGITNTATESATALNENLTYEKKELAFASHLEQLYRDADLQNKGLSFPVFKKAYIGFVNLKQRALISPSKSILTVVDFTKSSREERLWVIDLHARKVLFNTLVAHGRNTGNDKATKFSNQPNSYMSSLGFYVTDKTYYGKHGLSLRLQGMDKGFNTNAMQRAIVVHGADYATADFIKQYGRLGRSLGCPALPREISKEVIDVIKDETVLFVHHNDKTYSSDFLDMEKAVETFAAGMPDNSITI
ncbi:murein L,D-transpeptidase catalytic domain family protein [Pontibacter sp. Tf4]|uniref:murein L,D-transpeptidase catalytic domain family protein n=1 Tax=Pontibacter sp. Tf4 TaxID=2761620 RepID=UPI002104C7C8|nr:murein L,D-transpeptidase catalytic domain family protein [Pontibacter sp. Tf4]